MGPDVRRGGSARRGCLPGTTVARRGHSLTAMVDARSTDQRIADTRRRLEDDRDAWVASTNSDRPWLVPLSYLWHEEQLVFATNASTPTFTNLAVSAQLRVALGHARDVVILDGHATAASASSFTTAEIAAYQAKLGSNPRQWADSVIRLRPTRIQAWREENELAGRVLMRDGVWAR